MSLEDTIKTHCEYGFCISGYFNLVSKTSDEQIIKCFFDNYIPQNLLLSDVYDFIFKNYQNIDFDNMFYRSFPFLDLKKIICNFKNITGYNLSKEGVLRFKILQYQNIVDKSFDLFCKNQKKEYVYEFKPKSTDKDLYFLISKSCNVLKIGITQDIKKRMIQVKSESKISDFELLHFFKNFEYMESIFKECHYTNTEINFRKMGKTEYFDLNKGSDKIFSDISFLKKIASGELIYTYY